MSTKSSLVYVKTENFYMHIFADFLEPNQIDAIIGGQHNHRVALDDSEVDEIRAKLLENFGVAELEAEIRRRIAMRV